MKSVVSAEGKCTSSSSDSNCTALLKNNETTATTSNDFIFIVPSSQFVNENEKIYCNDSSNIISLPKLSDDFLLKQITTTHSTNFSFDNLTSTNAITSDLATNLLTTTKRKCDISSSTTAFEANTDYRVSPTFPSCFTESICSTSTRETMEFATPLQVKKSTQSRPNSPTNCQRILPTRSRIASLRRESDCSGENEVAHEKLVKTAQQVSLGFEDFCLDEKLYEERKRAKSLTEPISILTNAFLIQSSTPSPTRNVDAQKQCYSPSTQQVVRNNITYSPSPSPTPSSPTRSRIMRSMSPIAVRQISKRRYTGSGSGSGLESDSENSTGSNIPTKRQCITQRNAASPLVRDPFSGTQQEESALDDNRNTIFYPTTTSASALQAITTIRLSRHLDVSFNRRFCHSPLSADMDDNSVITELDNSYQSLCSNSGNDNSFTTFSSRAGTPTDEQINGTPKSASLSPWSHCSSAASPLATGGLSAMSSSFQPYTNAPTLLPSRAIQSTSSSSASSPQPVTVITHNYDQ